MVRLLLNFMIRITKMSGKYYGIKLTDDLEKEMDDIRQLVNECTPVILVDLLEDLESFDIYEDVIMVERD
jgi:hypothetical protein